MKTMRLALYPFFLGLLSLVVVSCKHKELCYDHRHTGTLNVVFDWSKAPDADVKGMYIYLYPTTGGAMQQFYLPKEGGAIEVTHGTYRVLGINSDTEATLVRGESDWETFELHTREASTLEGMTSMSIAGDVPKAEGTENQRTVLTPDQMYSLREQNVVVLETDENQSVVLYPEEATCLYNYEIRNVKGLEYVSDVSGTMSGMSPSYFVGRDELNAESATVPFSTQSDGVSKLSGSFVAFGCTDGPSKADAGHQMVIYAVMSDGSKYYYTYDVTDQVHSAENPRRVNIVLDGLEFSQPVGGDGDGGFQPSVGDWENEEVVLPM